jgi:N-acylneuraminate cytidylyltransferase/CMP-N,N'-diacetyllegionaminic acid synthase
LALTPARGGAKRLPGKNLRPLAGRSLLARTADALRGSAWSQSPCLLSTDDPAIREEGLALGMIAPWLRPPELATDDATTVDVALHALDWWRASRGDDPDILLLLQPTTPFRDPTAIDEALRKLETADLDAVIGASVVHRSPRSLFARGADGLLTALGEAGEPSSLLTPNGSLYAIRPAALRARRSFFPPSMAAMEMNAIHSIDIDTPEDWLIAEAVAGAIGEAAR